ncbi:hypothetical protein GCM10023335_53870 [Streptomyces siamensis]|uniref:Uncharacterized protein n=1 Tax=Streptomyces siamensis TaxID=1274986 RepID=A0ABP9J8D1_9ACTN
MVIRPRAAFHSLKAGEVRAFGRPGAQCSGKRPDRHSTKMPQARTCLHAGAARRVTAVPSG